MKYIKIDLNNKQERFFYSQKLREFENEFSYPLGDKKIFTISHGQDYFAFFEQMGKVSYFVILDHDKIIGAVCAILKRGYKSWYLCDFKIAKAYRGKKLYRNLMWKYFLSHYLLCSNMFAVNMSAPQNNKIFMHSKKIFKLFSLEIEPRFLSQFSVSQISKLPKNFWTSHYLVTNNGKKDIIIDKQIMPLFHIVPSNYGQTFTDKVDPFSIPSNAQIMFLNNNFLGLFDNEIEISFIHRNNSNLYISSAEI